MSKQQIKLLFFSTYLVYCEKVKAKKKERQIHTHTHEYINSSSFCCTVLLIDRNKRSV